VKHLLELGKRLRKREAGKPAINEREVRNILEQEFEKLLGGLPVQDHINPLLQMPGLNIHQDTPTEILHTILLGVVKYFWGQTIWILDKAHLVKTFQIRLDNIDENGLNSPTLGAEYICRYSGSLIGKHFKSLAQVMPFLIYDLVPSTVLNGWSIIGQLVVLLWHTKIDDVEEYLVCRVHNVYLQIQAHLLSELLGLSHTHYRGFSQRLSSVCAEYSPHEGKVPFPTTYSGLYPKIWASDLVLDRTL